MPYADVLPWDEISLTLDFNDIVENNLNALDVLSKQFDVERALTMARKVRSPCERAPLLLAAVRVSLWAIVPVTSRLGAWGLNA